MLIIPDSNPQPETVATVSDIPEDENFGPFNVISGVPVEGISEEPGSLIDEEIKREEPNKVVPEPAKTVAKGSAPNVAEWQRFFSRIVIRFLTDGYLALAFRGIDDELVTERDLMKLKMTADERDRIAVPFAEYANKSAFARKHGRMIVSAAGSFESMATLAIWMGRVNRISRKYKTPRKTTANRKANTHVDSGPTQQNGTGNVSESGITIHNPYT